MTTGTLEDGRGRAWYAVAQLAEQGVPVGGLGGWDHAGGELPGARVAAWVGRMTAGEQLNLWGPAP